MMAADVQPRIRADPGSALTNVTRRNLSSGLTTSARSRSTVCTASSSRHHKAVAEDAVGLMVLSDFMGRVASKD